jgi:polyhydroxybutyrate depolymerase
MSLEDHTQCRFAEIADRPCYHGAMIRPLLAVAAAFALVAAACERGDSGGNPETTATPTAGDTENTCSPARPHASGGTRKSINSGGITRTYILHVPATYDGASSTSIVLALHGFPSSAEDIRTISGFDTAAGARGTIAVYPEGTGAESRALGWNTEQFVNAPDDSLFLADLLDALDEALCIDATRVYVAGFSQGGGMAKRFACEAPERVAAVASVASTYTACQAAVPMVMFHGAKDPITPYEGGGLPVHRAASEWARALGCDGLPTISRATADVELSTYGNCTGGGAETLLYTAIDGGHTWPGTAVEFPEETAGKTTRSISATERMLDFFEDRQR